MTGRLATVAVSMLLAAACTRIPHSELVNVARSGGQDPGLAVENWLNSRFPVGSDEGPLVAYLRTEGFRIERVRPADRGRATLRWEAPVCSQFIAVNWRLDDLRRLTELKASAGDTGCL